MAGCIRYSTTSRHSDAFRENATEASGDFNIMRLPAKSIKVKNDVKKRILLMY